MIYLQDEAFHTASTKPAPPADDDFVNKVYGDVPPPTVGPSPFGPNGPNLSDYRVAWMFKRIHQGKHMSEVIADANYARVDPANLFAKGFPPTYFVHGTADVLVPHAISQRAHDELKSLGVETQIQLVEGGGHGFDAGATPGDDKFAVISRGFDFLQAHV
jgi:acetyl esterase/lipase